MAIDLVLQDIGSGYNVSKINDNFTKIEDAFEDVVSLSGALPNQMSSDLDMNSNDILNVNNIGINGSLLISGIDIGTLTTTILEVEDTVTDLEASAQDAANRALQSATDAAHSAGTNTPFEQQIHNATSKSPVADNDEFGIADSAASFGPKKVTFFNLFHNVLDKLGIYIITFTNKPVIANNDVFLISDSASGNAPASVKWSDILSNLVTSFGTLINTTTLKAVPIAGDLIPIADSASANASAHTTAGGVASYLDSRVGVKTGWITGLITSNSLIDTVNDIVISPGLARSSDDTADIYLPSSITKQLDAVWAVGTNAGGLSTGSISNTTYHVYVISRPDTGVVDVLFDTSATSPTLPTNYTKFRRIFSIVRTGGSIKPYFQDGDMGKWVTQVDDYSASGTRAKSNVTLTLPVGIRTLGLFQSFINGTGTPNVKMIIFDGVNTAVFVQNQLAASTAITTQTYLEQWTDTSAHIQLQISGSVSGGQTLTTIGWVDSRGK